MLISEKRRAKRGRVSGARERRSGARSAAKGRGAKRGERWDPVGKHEVAQILGITYQWADRLEKDRAAGKRNGFPAPVKWLAGGPLWDRGEIERFDQVRRAQVGPAPGTTARGPRLLAGYKDEDLAAVVNGAEAGLSEREREVLRMRLGDGEASGMPLGQAAVAERLNITPPAVKKAQQRAVDKVLAVLRGA